MDEHYYRAAHHEDRWIYNKLEVSLRAGWVCGPCGEPVPQDGEYIIRPVMNMWGMGREARACRLKAGDVQDKPGYFWCLRGEDDYQLSVDYARYHGQWRPILVVRGDKDRAAPMYRFSRWTKLDLSEAIAAPAFLSSLRHDGTINVEYVDEKPIEVHLRHNPDFQHGEEVCIPVWSQEDFEWSFRPDEEYGRAGFIVGMKRA